MLHGEIKVNHNEIAKWSAVNTAEQLNGDIVYKCKVGGRDMQGYPYEHSFIVLHNPSNGPLTLVCGIMAKANQYTKG